MDVQTKTREQESKVYTKEEKTERINLQITPTKGACVISTMTFRPQTEEIDDNKDLRGRITKLESSAATNNSSVDELAEMFDKMKIGELGEENLLMKEKPVIEAGPCQIS